MNATVRLIRQLEYQASYLLCMQKRMEVEDKVAEIAFRTRSAARQEIRSLRRESEALQAISNSHHANYGRTQLRVKTEQLLQQANSFSALVHRTKDFTEWTSFNPRDHQMGNCRMVGALRETEQTKALLSDDEADENNLSGGIFLASTVISG